MMDGLKAVNLRQKMGSRPLDLVRCLSGLHAMAASRSGVRLGPRLTRAEKLEEPEEGRDAQ
jgi:hypothetical protein